MIRRIRPQHFVFLLLVAAAACSGGKSGFSDPVDHLLVSPDGATIDSTTSIEVRAAGVTKSGRHVDVAGVTWVASAGAVTGTQFTPAGAGDATLTATAAGKTGTGTIHVIAPNTMDVTVVDAATGAGIQGASVTLLVGTGAVVTAAGGAGSFTGNFSGKVAIHTTAINYYPVTLYGVAAKKLKIPMRPVNPAPPGSFTGDLDFQTAFNADQPPVGSLWIGLAGPSIHGNILAFGIDSLLGPTRPISIVSINVDAPSNVVVYGFTPPYIAPAPAGPTAAWALGGPVEFSQITDILGGGGSDIGTVITGLLPTFNGFYYTLKQNLTIASNQTLQGQDLVLDRKLSKVFTLDVPPRPVTDPNPLVVGAVDLGEPQGFVPAGLTAVQGETTPSAEIRVPALTGELAGKSYLFLTVTQDGGFGSSGNVNQQLAILSRGITGQSTVQMPEFLTPPALGSFSATGATGVAMFPASTGAQLTLQTFTKTVVMGTGSNATATIYEWDVATPADSTGFTLPMVAGTNGASSGAAWTVQSLGLESQTYDALLTPGNSSDLSSYFNDANRIVITRNVVQ